MTVKKHFGWLSVDRLFDMRHGLSSSRGACIAAVVWASRPRRRKRSARVPSLACFPMPRALVSLPWCWLSARAGETAHDTIHVIHADRGAPVSRPWCGHPSWERRRPGGNMATVHLWRLAPCGICRRLALKSVRGGTILETLWFLSAAKEARAVSCPAAKVVFFHRQWRSMQ